ncbi:MAG TPA: DNA translocase FtsK 4TM domain-containing protein, partial [Opitutales bacterium]|nr:DNA translocase FtsK 4TM domain-containing protein [Opitutales bacterium]
MFGRKPKSSATARPGVKPKETTAFAPRRSPMHPFWALLCAAAAAFALLACATYRPGQAVYLPDWLGDVAGPTVPSNEIVGTFGATYAAVSNRLLGVAGMFLIPAFLLWLAYLLLFRRSHLIHWWKIALMFVTLFTGCGLADMMFVWAHHAPTNFLPQGYGGQVGEYLYSGLLAQPLGQAGSLIVLSIFYVVGLLLVFTADPGQSLEWWLQAWMSWREQRALAAKARQGEQERQKAARAIAEVTAKAAPAEPAKAAAPPEAAAAKDAKGLGSLKAGESLPLFSDVEGAGEALTPEQLKKLSGAGEEPPPSKLRLPRKDSGPKIIAEEKVEKFSPSRPARQGDYIFPPVSLLAPAQARQIDSPDFHKERAEQLVQTLSEFGVKVTPTEIHSGPVITRYEVVPAPGVRVEKIVNLDKNLALALRAEGVRIIAPVPGKGTVGIEVPNRTAANVCLREIIESKAWNDSNAEIPIVLGKDVTGKPMVVDLTKMPHALIAGSTGAGKTVCINAIIASLLFKMTAKDLRFIMVDPKIVEMQGYDSLPHMLVPVVTDPKKVPAALKYLIREMERRYKMFAQIGARNIAGFNAKVLQDDASQKKAEEMDAELSPEERAAAREIAVPRDSDLIEIKKEKLPYIVCIIDELADLMMAAPADIETCVARLAQLARAAGIHLILATQRPSVNVITGVIKANLPCRIAFKVASKVDSRTILDQGGADALIGRGDMLFVPPGAANLVRAQGAFVSDEEINQLVEFLKRNGDPEYDDDVQAQIEAGA